MKFASTLSIILTLTLFLVPSAYAIDVSTKILDLYKAVYPGEQLHFQVTIKNIDIPGRHDIRLEYIVYQGDASLVESRELKAVETQTSFLGALTIPKDAQPGSAILRVTINGIAQAEDTFAIRLPIDNFKDLKYYFILIAGTILFVGLMIWREIHKIYIMDVKNK